MSGYVANNRNERPAPDIPPYNGDFDKQPRREMEHPAPLEHAQAEPPPAQCVFAKPGSLPIGTLDYPKAVPAELASTYGQTAILAPTNVDAAGGLLLARAAGQVVGGGTWTLRGVSTAGVAGAGSALTLAASTVGGNRRVDVASFYGQFGLVHELRVGGAEFSQDKGKVPCRT